MNGSQDFTTGKILPKMLKFMLPILGALILQAMYGAVDLLVVGKFGTAKDISGVSTGSVIINLYTMVTTSLASGTMVLIGHYLGEKRENRIPNVIGGAFAFFGALSVVFSISAVPFARPLSALMQAPKEALSETASYVRICGAGVVFIVAYNLLSAIFRGLGDSKTPLLFVGIACVVNIVGDLLFVAVFKMGVSGAALATVMAQAVSVLLSLLIIFKRKLFKGFTLKHVGFNGEVKKFLKIGFPMALQSFLTDISFMMLCAFINRIGLEASSGYGVAHKIVSFVMLIPSSIMQSMASFVSQNVGAGDEKRAKKTLFIGMGLGAAIGVFVALFTFFWGDLMSGIFTNDAAVISRSAEYLRGFAPEAILTCILFSFMGYYNGHSKTIFVMAQGLIQTFLVRVPVSYFMSIQENPSLQYIGLATPLATIFGITISTVYYIIFCRQLKKQENVPEIVIK